MSSPSVLRDAKEIASSTFHGVIEQTRENFPVPHYRPCLYPRPHIKAGPHGVFANSDGTGTKPELAERILAEWGDSRFLEFPAFDVLAMTADDASRDGLFVVGVVNSIDVNDADPALIAPLARGMKAACDKGRFALLNGETAELGYRTPGYGSHRLNWNATTLTIVNDRKIIDGSGLKPGQPVIGLRETSIRSNGLTRARAILECAYLCKEHGKVSRIAHITELLRTGLQSSLPARDILPALKKMFPGTDIPEQIQLPWHTAFPDITKRLAAPSTIYTPLIYEAQGGVDGERNVPLVACAHVSGGGVPLKGKRMVQNRGVGLDLTQVFPDPEGVADLMRLAKEYPKDDGSTLVDNRSASEQWNRGTGFLCVTEHRQHADDFIVLARGMGYEADVIGETTDRPIIRWCEEEWTLE